MNGLRRNTEKLFSNGGKLFAMATDLPQVGLVEGRVDVAEMMGSSVHLHISALGRDVIIIVPTTEMQGGFRIGDPVRFSFKGSVAHVFSKETDKNLEY